MLFIHLQLFAVFKQMYKSSLLYFVLPDIIWEA